MRIRGTLLAVIAAVATIAVAAGGGSAGSTEYVVNGSFESSLDGWQGFNGALSLVPGVAGARAARVTATTTDAYSIFPWPRPVASTVKGALYTGRAWFRGDGSAREICLRIREWTGPETSTVVGSARVCAKTSKSWQQFPALEYRPLYSKTVLDVYVYRTSGSRGETFDVDGVSLVSADYTPPETTIASAPSGTVASSSATISFTASEQAAFQCSLDGGSYGWCSSPRTLTGLRDGAHTFRVRAVDTSGNVDATPASVTWTVDTTAPDTAISSAPSGAVASTSATVSFWATEASSTFSCSLDGAAPAACTSPVALTGLAEGAHTFAVAATGAVGNRDTSPAIATWSVDTTPPQTTISAAPAAYVATGSATITFGADDPGARFECSLDGAAFAACTSPAGYTGLADGAHTFAVRGVDTLGNADATPATATWTVDTVAPDTAVDSGPSGDSSDRSPSLAFSSNESTVTFECRLDGGAFATCKSPQSYSSLSWGSHTFEVRATDAAGNVDASPAARAWRTVPASIDTTIASHPAPTSRQSTQQFTFTNDVSDNAVYECSVDGGDYAPCGATTRVYVWANKHTLAVRATFLGVTDPTPATWTWWVDTPLENGNFEAPLGGWANSAYTVPAWKGFGADVALVDGGVAGPKALRVSYTNNATAAAFQDPFPIAATLAQTYRAGGFVKAVAGKTVCVRLRERNAGGIVQTQRQCVTTDGTWQQFPAVSITTAEGNQLELAVHSTGSAAGDTYDVDGLWLDDGAADPVQPEDDPEPVLLAFGDAGACWSAGDAAVGRLLDRMSGTVAILGDTVYNDGLVSEYTSCFDPAFGRHKARIKPSVGGDHEYKLPGAPGYWSYFGEAAGAPQKGWYSYDLGTWHIVVLNSACEYVGGCAAGSEQYEWLRADLAANAKRCIGAYFAEPRWSSGSVHGPHPNVGPFVSLLYGAGAEWMLGGDDHVYERFAPQDPSGKADPKGVRQFVVGTGGGAPYSFATPLANSEVRGTGTYGLLKLTLRDGAYDWRFVPISGKTFTDGGTATCSS